MQSVSTYTFYRRLVKSPALLRLVLSVIYMRYLILRVCLRVSKKVMAVSDGNNTKTADGLFSGLKII